MKDNGLRNEIKRLFQDPVIVICFVGYIEMYSLGKMFECKRIPRMASCTYAMEKEVATLVKLKYSNYIDKITSIDDYFS